MLSAPNRMRRSSDFGAAVRRGRRAGTRNLVVHALVEPGVNGVTVGFVVSKAVGGAVVRNRTKRRLRALVRPLVPAMTPGSRIVIRAQPPAAAAPISILARDLSAALRRTGSLSSAEVTP